MVGRWVTIAHLYNNHFVGPDVNWHSFIHHDDDNLLPADPYKLDCETCRWYLGHTLCAVEELLGEKVGR